MTANPNPPPAPPATDDLQFDRAESASPPPTAPAAGAAPTAAPAPSATTCAVCSQPIADTYFEANGKIICPRCHQLIIAHHASGSPVGRFFKAATLGIAAGAVGAALWWGVRKVSEREWAIV